MVYQKLKEDIDKPGDNKPGQDKPGDSKPNQKPGGSSGNSGGTGNQSGTNKNQKNDNLHQMNWQEGRPNTGDQTALHFYIDLLIVSMIGLVAIVRKLKIDKKK